MGFIDLHSHLLPGIDDGCVAPEESLACVRHLRAEGFVGTVCTPHILPDIYPHNTPDHIKERVAALGARLRAEGLDYPLWAGGEVRLAPDTLSWFEAMGVPTLGPSRYVLVDYWGQRWPDFADRALDHLLHEGFVPVLAHPERMDFPDAHWEATLADLTGRGVRLQGNLNSLAGGEGERARERSWRLLKRGGYYLIASDMHRPHQLDSRMHGIGLLRDALGEEVNTLLGDRPRAIVSAESH